MKTWRVLELAHKERDNLYMEYVEKETLGLHKNEINTLDRQLKANSTTDLLELPLELVKMAKTALQSQYECEKMVSKRCPNDKLLNHCVKQREQELKELNEILSR